MNRLAELGLLHASHRVAVHGSAVSRMGGHALVHHYVSSLAFRAMDAEDR